MDKKTEFKTKQNIMDTATALYYEKGMNQVPFAEIAAVCGVTKPLISYHFGSKVQLANEIYGSVSIAQQRVFFSKVEQLGKKYDIYETFAAYILQTVKYYMEDRNAFRFYTDFFSCSFQDVTALLEEKTVAALPGPETAEERHMKYIGVQYAARGLIYHYVTGEIRCGWEEFARYFTQLNLTPFSPSIEPEQYLPGAFEILNQIHLEFKPSFQWE